MNKTIAFKNVTVLPMDSDRVLPNHTVIVCDGIIQAVETTSSTPIPSDATIIDGTNKFLMPGLIDMHVHLSSKNTLDLFLANGITTVRNMWGWKKHVEWRDSIEKHVLRGPHIITSGPIVDRAPPIWNGAVGINNPDDAEKLVLEQIEHGFDFLKIYSGLSQKVYDALIAAARKHNFPIAGHLPFPVGFDNGLSNPADCFEHLMCYMDAAQRDDSPVKNKYDRISRVKKVDYIDESKIPKIVETTVKSNVWNCPTLTVIDKLFVSLEQAEKFRQRDEMRHVSRLTAASWQPLKDFRLKELTEDQRRHYMTHLPFYKKMIYELFKAGGNLLIGSDAPNPFVIPGYSLHDELELFVDCGIPPFDTLHIATYQAAHYLKQETVLGSVTPGKRADLLLLDADPRANIKNARRQAGIMVNGVWFKQSQLERWLEEKAALRVSNLDKHWLVHGDTFSRKLEHSINYSMYFNDVLFGKEYVSCMPQDDGSTTITSIIAMQGMSSMHLETDVILSSEQKLCSLKVKSLTDEHSIDISRQFHCCVESQPVCASVVVLPTPLLMGYVPFAINSYIWLSVFKSLEVGETANVSCSEFEVYPESRAGTADVSVVRLSEQKYSLTFTTQFAQTHCDVQFDENDELLSLEIHERLGEIVFKRD